MAKRIKVLRGERLRHLLEARGFSQDEFAQAVGTSQQHVSKWLRGVTDPLPEQLVSMAQALNVSVDYLLGLVDDETAVFAPDVSMSALELSLLRKLREGNLAEALDVLARLTKRNNEAGIVRQ